MFLCDAGQLVEAGGGNDEEKFEGLIVSDDDDDDIVDNLVNAAARDGEFAARNIPLNVVLDDLICRDVRLRITNLLR